MQPCFVNIFFDYSKKFLLSTFWSYFAKFCGEFLTYSCENSLLAKYLRLLSAVRAPYFSSISKIFLFIALAFIGNMIYNIYSATNTRAEARDPRSMYDQISNGEKPHISAAIQPGVGPEKPADPWPLFPTCVVRLARADQNDHHQHRQRSAGPQHRDRSGLRGPLRRQPQSRVHFPESRRSVWHRRACVPRQRLLFHR